MKAGAAGVNQTSHVSVDGAAASWSASVLWQAGALHTLARGSGAPSIRASVWSAGACSRFWAWPAPANSAGKPEDWRTPRPGSRCADCLMVRRGLGCFYPQHQGAAQEQQAGYGPGAALGALREQV